MSDLNFKEWKDSLRSFIEASANDIKWLQQLKVDKEQKIISENPELFEITGGWTDDPSGDGNYRIKKGTGLQDLINDSHKKVTVADGDDLHNSPSSTTEVNGLILRGSEQELGVRTATRNNYGVVKLSSDLNVDQDGKLIITKDDFELNPATETDLGGVIVPISSKIDVDVTGVIDVGTDVATGIKFNSSTKVVTLINKNENGVTSGHSEIDLSGIAEMGTHFWYNPDGGDGYGYLEIYEDEDWDAVNNRPNAGATPTTSIPILDMLEGIGTELKFGDGSVGKEKYKLYLTDDSKTEYLSDGVSINIENVKELENELGDRVKKNSLVKAKEGIEVRRTRSPEGAFGSQTELGDIPEFRIDKDFEDFNKYRTKAVQDTMHWRLKVGTSEIDVKPDGGDGELNPDTVELRGAGGVTVSKVANTSEDIIEIKGTTYSEITETEVVDKTSSSKRLISGRRFWKGFSTLIAEWWSDIEVSFAKMQNIPTKTLIGRYAVGDGKPQSITLGSNLTLSETGVLNSANDNNIYTASKGVKKVTDDFQADIDGTTIGLEGDTMQVLDSPSLGGIEADKYATEKYVDDIEIGGRNLLPKSDSYDRWYGLSNVSVTKTKVDMSDEWGFSNAVRMITSGGTGVTRLIYTTSGELSEPLVLDQFYTYSIYIKNMGEKDIILRTNGLGYLSNSVNITIKAGESGRFSATGHRRDDYDWFQPQFRTLSVNDDLDVIIGYEKIEKGNKPTDWTPAPEDQVTDFLQEDEDAFDYLKNRELIALKTDLNDYIPYTGANQDVDLNVQKITHDGIVYNEKSITSPWFSHSYLTTDNKVAYLIIDGFTADTERQLYIEVESVSGNGELKRLVKGFNVRFYRDNTFNQSDSRYLEVTGSGGSSRYGIGEVEKHSDTALKIPLIWIGSVAQSTNKISVKCLTGYVSNLTFSSENDAISTLTTEDPYLYRNSSEKWVNEQIDNIPTIDISGKADKTTEIIAGIGLEGGGDLDENRTLSFASGASWLNTSTLISSDDLNDIVTAGYYSHGYITRPDNTPASRAGYVEVLEAPNAARQFWLDRDNTQMYTRVLRDGLWSDWVEFWTSYNLPNPATETFVGDAIDDIEIGGRNYALLENNIGRVDNSSGTTIVDIFNQHYLFREESKYVLSFEYSGEGVTNFVVSGFSYPISSVSSDGAVGDSGGGSLNFPITMSDGVKKAIIYITTESWVDEYNSKPIRIRAGENSDVTIENVKFERGTKPTDWSPAPEDQVTDWDETNPDAFSYLKNVPAKLKSATDDDVDNWNAALHEVDSKATKNEAEAGTNNTKYMTPLRTVEAMKGHEWIDYDPFEVYDTIVNGTTP